jgi:hypothetical protein
METRNILPALLALFTATLLISPSASAATPPLPPDGGSTVTLTGWLHVEDYTMEDMVVEVNVNGSYQIARVSGSGRFTVELPADAKCTLRFEKPGHLPKEVLVDTRHMHRTGQSQRNRHVRFAVIMELERFMGGMTYAGPVGSIGFDPDGGCLAVSHDKGLVPAARHAPMVF